MNPVSTLFHIAPCCFVFLFLPFTYIELPKILADPEVVVNVPLLLASAACAFALNMAVFLLIGKTSALTMNIAGVVKDWLLIGLSVVLFGSPVSGLQLFGYGIAFAGVMYYNYQKIQAMKQSQTGAEKAPEKNIPIGTREGSSDSLAEDGGAMRGDSISQPLLSDDEKRRHNQA